MVQYNRASDIFVPPQNDSTFKDWSLEAEPLSQFIIWLDQEKFTGVIKVSSHSQKFRGALLLYTGWCVGALYSQIDLPPVKHTHLALSALLKALGKTDSAQIEIYTLPEDIVLPFASAFIGQFMEPAQEGSPQQIAQFFVEKISGLPRHCLITMRLEDFENRLCLVYFYWGKISGHFLVDQQQFIPETDFPFQYIVGNASLRLSILSPEIDGVYGGQTRFGFPLALE